MNNRLELGNPGIEVELQGKVFLIDVEDPDFIEELSNFHKEATKEAQRLKAFTGENYADGLRQATAFTCSAIDKILGDGATSKIFEGRKIRFTDTLKIITHIQDVASANNAAILETYKSYANRAQRRAEGKK